MGQEAELEVWEGSGGLHGGLGGVWKPYRRFEGLFGGPGGA